MLYREGTAAAALPSLLAATAQRHRHHQLQMTDQLMAWELDLHLDILPPSAFAENLAAGQEDRRHWSLGVTAVAAAVASSGGGSQTRRVVQARLRHPCVQHMHRPAKLAAECRSKA